MKTKTNPKIVESGDYLYQNLMKGLSKRQQSWAKEQVKKFDASGFAVPYGIIRKEAIRHH